MINIERRLINKIIYFYKKEKYDMNTELDRLNLQDSLTAAKEMILNIIDNNADIFDEEKMYIVKSEIENIFFDLTEKV